MGPELVVWHDCGARDGCGVMRAWRRATWLCMALGLVVHGVSASM